jgi:hypothetical protein
MRTQPLSVLLHSSWIPALLALFVALVAAPALADIGPGPNLKRVEATHSLEAVEGFEGYALFLITTNARESWSLYVRPVSRAGGDLDVPSGYMNRTVMAALTQDQLVELAKLALPLQRFSAERAKLTELDDAALAAYFATATWDTTPEDMEAYAQKARTEIPIMAIFMRDDVATSETLPFRTEVDRDSEAVAIKTLWRVKAISGGELTLESVKRESLTKEGQWIVAPPTSTSPPSDSPWGLWIGLAFLGAGLLLTVTLRPRRPVATPSGVAA